MMVAPCATSLSSEIARPPAIRLRWVRGTATEAVRRHVERNHRRLAAILDDRARWSADSPQHRLIERGHAFGQIVAEAADVADRKSFGGGVHGEVGVDDAVDPADGDDGARAGAVERDRQFRLAPQQRQQRDHQAGAMRGQHGQRELDRVRQLHRDHRIGRQARLR